jgi:hypothetical protein
MRENDYDTVVRPSEPTTFPGEELYRARKSVKLRAGMHCARKWSSNGNRPKDRVAELSTRFGLTYPKTPERITWPRNARSMS